MKKAITIIMIIVIVGVGGFTAYYFYDKNMNNDKLSAVMVPMAEDYFDKYMSANTSSNTYTVTLANLKDANKNGGSYDVSGLNACDNNSAVDITIDYNTGKIINTTANMKCK